MNVEYANLFWFWIKEREHIRKQKEAGVAPPWTDDPIMKYYHFCNVRREDDRTTKEIRKVVRDHKVDYWDLPWVYTAARMFNKAKTLGILLDDGWPGVRRFRDSKKDTVFHTAYVVSTCGKSMDKVEYVERVVKDVHTRVIPTAGCKEAYLALRAVDGLGSFMAGQVVADLKNDRYLNAAYDWDTWSAIGPGSAKGLAIIFGYEISERIYQHHIDRLYAAMPPDVKAMNIHAQDLQNCLCEFSKYVRLLENRKGRRRPYYARQDVQHVQH